VTKEKWQHPFGRDYRGRNQVEAYLRLIFASVDNDDGPGLKELFDEMDKRQHEFIWRLLASHTRAKIKSLL
jgi:hypothetical protein